MVALIAKLEHVMAGHSVINKALFFTKEEVVDEDED